MTKKDFIKTAETFKGLKPSHPVLLGNWRKYVEDMCAVFVKNNPRFDPIRFKTACGY